MTALLLVALTLADTPAQSYQVLEADHQAAIAAYQKALGSATTVEERQTLARSHQAKLTALADRFLALAGSSPRSPQAVDALAWVTLNAPWPPAPGSEDQRAQALAALGKEYIRDERLGPLCTRLVRLPDEASERFLRAAFDNSPHEGVQARAGMSLALNRKFRAGVIERLKANPAEVKGYEAVWGPASVKVLLARDPAVLLDSSRKLLTYVRARHGNLKHPQHGDLARMAEAVLATLDNPVAVGQPAPPLRGTDLAGKEVTLASLKGKVVLLDFGGTQFAPTTAAYALQKALLKRHAGDPLVLLSVTASPDRAACREVLDREGVTWTTLFDGGGTGGPLATRWDVEAWPTVFVIDAAGVVRNSSVGWPPEGDLSGVLAEAIKKAR